MSGPGDQMAGGDIPEIGALDGGGMEEELLQDTRERNSIPLLSYSDQQTVLQRI